MGMTAHSREMRRLDSARRQQRRRSNVWQEKRFSAVAQRRCRLLSHGRSGAASAGEAVPPLPASRLPFHPVQVRRLPLLSAAGVARRSCPSRSRRRRHRAKSSSAEGRSSVPLWSFCQRRRHALRLPLSPGVKAVAESAGAVCAWPCRHATPRLISSPEVDRVYAPTNKENQLNREPDVIRRVYLRLAL
jgi:hypothetical protein